MMSRLTNFILLTVVWLAADAALAQEIFYFADKARDLEVSADAETLLVFPSPPFARVCQPAGVLDLYPIDGDADLQNMLLPHGVHTGLPGVGVDNAKPSEGTNDLVSRHLKLVPLKPTGVTTCAIRLATEQVVTVRFTLSKMVNKPIIEFRSQLDKAQAGAVTTQSIGALNLFRALVLGGDLTFLADDTPSEWASGPKDPRPARHLSRSTDLATYTLTYVGTDKDLFKAWKFEGTAEVDFSPSPVRPATMGTFYFSAFKPKSGTVARPHFNKGEAFQFFVLSCGDVTPAEMLEHLP